MKPWLRIPMVVFFAVAILCAAETGQSLFQKALTKERAEADPARAIILYERVVKEFARDHKLAAEALFRIGECHQALGNAEAKRAFERLVREYPEQTKQVEDARARLSALEQAGGLSHPLGITLRKVWAMGHGELTGSPSPDGRYFSFADRETGDLALRDLATGQNRRLTNGGKLGDSGESAEGSVISGDGKQIAYAWHNKDNYYELRVIGIDGSNPRTVYRDKEFGFWIEPWQWTADGKQILAALMKGRHEEQRIVLISVAGEPVRILKTQTQHPWYPSLSPDGRFLVYSAPTAGGSEGDIFLFSLEGGRETPLVRQPANDWGPFWAPDGSRVLFISDRTGTNGLWTIDVVEGKPRGIPQLWKDGLDREIRPNGFTRQGAFYFSANTSISDVYVAELDQTAGKVVRELTPAAPRFVGSISLPSWSPDGRYLAYYRGGSAYNEEPTTLVILSVETGEARDVPVKLDLVLFSVRWFPDAKSLLVGAWDSANREKVAFYRVDTETGDHRLVRSSADPGTIVADVSPDGKTMFFWQGEAWEGQNPKAISITAREIENGRERKVAQMPFWGPAARIAISPDGLNLAILVTVDEGKAAALKLVPVSGGEQRELYRLQQSEAVPEDKIAWSPDGRNVLFLRNTGKDGIPELWRIPASGGEPQRMGLAMEGMRHFAPHPDGRRIAFDTGTRKESPNELWVLENFLAAAERRSVPSTK